MIFRSTQIKGKGRGRHLGFPTINLAIPDDFVLDTGIYAAWIEISGKIYKGALYYGDVPVFAQKEKSLEVYLLDSIPDNFFSEGEIEVDVVQKIRDVMNFIDPSLLVDQMHKDVTKIKIILK
jgi:riboflavin kinase/FMN adenylyltransferase